MNRAGVRKIDAHPSRRVGSIASRNADSQGSRLVLSFPSERIVVAGVAKMEETAR
jgi:hypothetical protein